jgi:hypothetical protein
MIFRDDIVSYSLTKLSYIILPFITRFCLIVLLFLCVVYFVLFDNNNCYIVVPIKLLKI